MTDTTVSALERLGAASLGPCCILRVFCIAPFALLKRLQKQVRLVYKERTLSATKAADDYMNSKDMTEMFAQELNREFIYPRGVAQAKEVLELQFLTRKRQTGAGEHDGPRGP